MPLCGDATALPSLRGRTVGMEEGRAWCQCHLRAVTTHPLKASRAAQHTQSETRRVGRSQG